MLRILFYFVQVAALVAAALFLAEHPGEISFDWLGYRVDTYFGVALVVLLAAAVLLLALYRFWRGLMGLPGGFLDRRAARRREEGYRALTLGMAAIAAGDAEEARRQARRAENLLEDPGATRLLAAQAASLGGDEKAATRYFDALIEAPETRFVGLTGKLRLALGEADKGAARTIAEEARRLRPDSAFVTRTLFDLQARAGDWPEAQATLFDAVRRKIVPEPEGRRHRTAIFAVRARIAEAAGDLDAAGDLADKALEATAGFAPAVTTRARALAGRDRKKQAARLIEDAWRAAPHRALVEPYLALWPEEDAVQRLKRVQTLVGAAPEHAESRLAVAEAAIKADLWGEARRQLEAIPTAARTARAWRLQAHLEQAENRDTAAARALFERAAAGPEDHAWTCTSCGAVSADWSALCGHCGAFDTVVWKQPPRVSVLAGPLELASQVLEVQPGERPARGGEPAPGTEAKSTGAVDNPEDLVRRLA